MKSLCGFLMFLGRLCISAIFLFAGLGKLLDYEGTAALMEAKGMTMIPFFLYGAVAVELIGALSLILGYKTRWGAILLILFLIPTSIIFHDFWNFEGMAQQEQAIHFLSNIAIFGGLLHVLCCGSEGYSCDRGFCPFSGSRQK